MTNEFKAKLEQIANSSNIVSINNGNHKTGKACLTLSLPVCSCRDDAPCKLTKVCYCMKGHQQYPNVLGAYFRNWRLWNENPNDFEEQVNFFIKRSGLFLFRWMDAGDIPNKEFFEMQCRIASKNPEVRFLCYTKKYNIVNDYLREENKIPSNFTVRFSYWDKNWEVDNPFDLPTAYVDFKDSDLNPEIPTECFKCPSNKENGITCSVCRACFNEKIKNVKFIQH